MLRVYNVFTRHITALAYTCSINDRTQCVDDIKHIFDDIMQYNFKPNSTTQLYFTKIDYKRKYRENVVVRKRKNKYTMKPFSNHVVDLRRIGVEEEIFNNASNFMVALYDIQTGQSHLYIFSVDLFKTDRFY